eukprot:751563-Hanusia_phi.AAC.1
MNLWYPRRVDGSCMLFPAAVLPRVVLPSAVLPRLPPVWLAARDMLMQTCGVAISRRDRLLA